MPRPRLLIVSYIFPPQLLARSLQLLKTVNALCRLGWEVTAYTADPALLKETCDPALLEKLDPSVRIVKGATLESWLLSNAVASLHIGMPDDKLVWRWKGKGALRKLLETERFDALASFGLKWSSHLLAREVKRFSGLPWLAHFSDPWVDNPYTPMYWPVSAVNRAQERSVCLEADVLAFTTEPTRDLVLRKHGPEIEKKGLVVPHCFAPELYPKEAPREDGHLNFVHVGYFYGKRTPVSFLRALALFLERCPEFRSVTRARFVGQGPEKYQALTEELGLAENVEYIPRVPYLESLRHMREATVLFSMDFVAKSLLSKLPDCIGAGRPLFAISDLESPTAAYTEKFHGLVARQGDVQDIAKKIEIIARSWQKDRSLPEMQYTREEAALFESTCTTRLLSEALLKMAGHQVSQEG